MNQFRTIVPILEEYFSTYDFDFFPEHSIFLAENVADKLKFVFSAYHDQVVVDCYYYEPNNASIIWGEPSRRIVSYDFFESKQFKRLIGEHRLRYCFDDRQ